MGLERAMDVRATGTLGASRVFDVHFPELIADPIAMIRRIYGHFDMPLSPLAEERVRAFLAENAADKHGTHRYTLGAAGLDVEAERRRYARYQQHFGIASEPMR